LTELGILVAKPGLPRYRKEKFRVSFFTNGLEIGLTCSAKSPLAPLCRRGEAFLPAANDRYEIKTIDLVFLVIPLIVVSLATGKIKGLDMFGVKADSLPVVDEQKRFTGTVDRGQLTASLILAVSDKLEGR
jgi:hypothetical protein